MGDASVLNLSDWIQINCIACKQAPTRMMWPAHVATSGPTNETLDPLSLAIHGLRRMTPPLPQLPLWMARLSTDKAASCTASDSVG